MIDDLPRLAHARALMLGSSAFPPATHLAYLREHGPAVGAGLGRVEVADLVLRDVDVAAERSEVIRVVAETLIALGQTGTMLDPATIARVPPALVDARLTWFGIERGGRLVGLHGGFFWSRGLWIRRFSAVLGDPYPPDVDTEIRIAIYDHLRTLGMREAMIQLPVGTGSLAARRAEGWVDSHEVHFAGNRQPGQWLRRAFRPRRHVAAFPSTWGPIQVREGAWPDLVTIRAQSLARWWRGSPEHQARVGTSIPHLWGLESASVLLGALDGVLSYGYLIRESSDDPAAAVISSLHPPGVHLSAAAFYYAAMAWMAAAGYTTYKAYIRPDCSGRNALAHDCLAQGGTLTWVPSLGKVLTSYPLAALLARPIEEYVPHWQALVAGDQSDSALPPEFPREALAWAQAQTQLRGER